MDLEARTTSTYSMEDCPSRTSKSENKSAFLSRYCKSATAALAELPTRRTASPLVVTVFRPWSKWPTSSKPTPTATSTVAAAATTGRRSHDSQPLFRTEVSSRNRACNLEWKYGEGSGARHSSSSAIVCCNEANSRAHEAQLRRCSRTSGEADSGPLSIASIKSERMFSHFITAPYFPLI